jgi:beta-ribofuranosylaminobenzene 5'-phosphate synthase
MIQKLKLLEKNLWLSSTHKILLATDGSITRVLEALTGEEVKIATEVQEIIKASEEVAQLLGIARGEEVNYRVVNLKDSKRTLVHATSYTPLKRLKKEFAEDIMKKDVPIGKIMSKLKIEARREIRDFKIIKADEKLSKVFGISPDSVLLKRNYNIIHRNEILLNITEIFPYETFINIC